MVKNLSVDARDVNPWVRKIPWRRHGNPLQYSCLENPMDREAWWATVQRVAHSQTQLKQLSKSVCTHTHMHNGILLSHNKE